MGIEYMKNMPNCPICGKRFFVAHDIFGYSAGCSGYYDGDDVHKKKMIKYNLPDKNSCIYWWQGVCEKRANA